MIKHSIWYFLLLFSLGSCCSDQVGFSYDATSTSSSPNEAVKFLKKNGEVPSQVVFVADNHVLHSLCGSEETILYVVGGENGSLQKSKASIFSWVKSQSFSSSSCTNRIFIVLDGHVTSKKQLTNLLSLLSALRSAMAILKIGTHVKLSVSFSLPFWKHALEKPHNSSRKLHLLIDYIRRSGSSVILNVRMDGELSMGDGFVRSCTEIVNNVTRELPYDDLSMLINVQNNAVPSPMELSQFSKKMIQYLKNKDLSWPESIKLFAEIPFMDSFEYQESNREQDPTFSSKRRELFYQTSDSSKPETTRHDVTNGPAFNPVAPINNPLTPPATFPGTIPGTTPVTNPITVSPTNPVTVPGIGPSPITNPVTTPPTMPITNPVTNPITPGTTPINPVTVPIITPTNPVTVSPVVPGQSWCIARRGSLTTSLQVALDYACGIGGVDCSSIQQNGVCYYPNTLENHASYAFNSYYLKNPTATSCNFGGTAMVVNTDPSSAPCIYPPASPIPNPITGNNPISNPIPNNNPITNPIPNNNPIPNPIINPNLTSGTGTAGFGNLPTVFNTSNPLGSTVFGAQPPFPNKAMSARECLSSSSSLLLSILLICIMKHF